MMNEGRRQTLKVAQNLYLQMPLIQQYNKPAELSNSYVFKLRPEELR